jgi:ribulose bisphosphate carboxylase small subunit
MKQYLIEQYINREWIYLKTIEAKNTKEAWQKLEEIRSKNKDEMFRVVKESELCSK